ncbi:MAG: galactokinase family protein [Rothia sp. (in: high G+C Gram-positive bacteria)]|nr:galactokinase family protein [Rothia sp. (in: high G+C Gram-positive bacteria)]
MTKFADPMWDTLPDHEAQIEKVRQAFIEKYHEEPDGVWSAPGRLNLLGEYIDFLGGSCMPMPLPYRTFVAGKTRSDGVLRANSLQMPGDERTVVIQEIKPGALKGWFTYVAGVAWSMNQEGGKDIALPLNFGADLVVDSRVPVGGGLSSSAALECSTALALLDLSCPLREGCETTEALPSDLSAENDELRARLAQVCIRAENEVAGAHTGGLDQSTSLRSRARQALIIDFRDFSLEPVDADLESAGFSFLVINTNTPHELSGNRFAIRRAASEECTRALGLDYLRNALPEDLTCAEMNERQAKLWRLKLVDQLTTEALDAVEHQFGQPSYPRGWIRHVFHDMCLVERAAFLLKNTSKLGEKALIELGKLFTESFVSMRDELQVSREEIDTAVATALDAGALGARMVGGGFGGAVMALVKTSELDNVARAVANAYAQHGYAEPQFLPMVAGFAADKDL